LPGPCEKVKKVISPNDDGRNDQFIVVCANRFDLQLQVFNRWGQLVFLADGYANDWTGTDMDGNQLPEGGYFYVLEFVDGEGVPQQIKGALNILY